MKSEYIPNLFPSLIIIYTPTIIPKRIQSAYNLIPNIDKPASNNAIIHPLLVHAQVHLLIL